MCESKRGWTVDMDDIVLKYYPLGGCALCVKKGLDKKLSTIRMRAKKFGITCTEKQWSDNELATLFEMHQLGSKITHISRKLDCKSCKSVRQKMDELGLTTVLKWSKEEIAILRKYYSEGGSKLVRKNGVSKTSAEISSKANSMGLRLLHKRVEWSEEEVDIVKKYYAREGLNVAKRLNNKTDKHVISKLNTLNTQYRVKYPNWSKSDVLTLRTNIFKTIEELSVLLSDKSKEEIEDMRSYLSFKYRENKKSWTDSDMSLLKTNYQKYSVSEIQEMGLDKPKTTIYKKLSDMGLTKGNKRKEWTADEVSILTVHYPYKTPNEMCDLLPDKTYTAIRCKASLLGVTKMDINKWSDKEIRLLKKYYPVGGSKGVLNAFEKQCGGTKRTVTAIHRKASKMGLRINDIK